MGPEFIMGVLGGVLLASLILNVYQWATREDLVKHWKLRTQDADDARKAQELRSADQINAMLDRIRTSERLEFVAPPTPAPEPEERAYISEFPYEDERWNDFRESTEKESA